MNDNTPPPPSPAKPARNTSQQHATSEALLELAIEQHLAGDLKTATDLYQQALQVDENNAKVLLFFGILHNDQGKHAEAEQILKRSLTLNPKQVLAYQNLGRAQAALRHFDDAMTSLQTALRLPQCPLEVYNDLGSVYRKVGRLSDSEDCYHKLLAVEPNNADAYNNLGNTLRDRGELTQAMQYFQTALQLQPDDRNAMFNMGFTALLAGHYKTGWKYYQQRLYNMYYQEIVNQPSKFWQTTPPSGETLLVIAEQGLGDTLQFMRFIPMARKFYRRIIFMVQKDLVNFLRPTALADVFIEKDASNISGLSFDAYIHLMSLPYVLDITLDNLPTADSLFDKVTVPNHIDTSQITETSSIKVGIAWAGNPNFTNDFNRSCPMQYLAPLLATKGVTFLSLQKGPAETQLQQLPPHLTIVNLMDSVNSFNDTAAIINTLDLVITVDTVIAHLAGNLNKPTWVLLPYAPDWRWLRERRDSPWYPSVILYRQVQPKYWSELISRVATDLQLYVSKAAVPRIS